MLKILGHVDLETGIIYDNDGNVVPKKESKVNIDGLAKRLEEITARRAEFFRSF